MGNSQGTLQTRSKAQMVDQNYAHGTFFMAMSTLESLEQKLCGIQGKKTFGAYDHYDYSYKGAWELIDQLITHVQLLDASIIAFQRKYGDTYTLPENFDIERVRKTIAHFKTSFYRKEYLESQLELQYSFMLTMDIEDMVERRKNESPNYRKLKMPTTNQQRTLRTSQIVSSIQMMHDEGDRMRAKEQGYKHQFKDNNPVRSENHEMVDEKDEKLKKPDIADEKDQKSKNLGSQIRQQQIGFFESILNQVQKIKESPSGNFKLLITGITLYYFERLVSYVSPEDKKYPEIQVGNLDKAYRFSKFLEKELTKTNTYIFTYVETFLGLRYNANGWYYNKQMLENMNRMLEYKPIKNKKTIVIVLCNNPQAIQSVKLEKHFTILEFKDTLSPRDADFLMKRGVRLSQDQILGRDKIRFSDILLDLEKADRKTR